MQTVTDVLEQQGRSAGLPDVIISNILNQLTVQVEYDPFECKTVSAPDPGTTMVKGVMNVTCCQIASSLAARSLPYALQMNGGQT
ncbi:hypothetical protein KIN20_008696 [Parelaphostrongylus tenuis]|uniref:Uncharacterized protein n=1 Tax=Parelaphostrongylus tenuis TaxID=148309 RepID=A0AAD5MPE4_PARTN|nr:hypothetical protein KIN20_008696 [Parelaphostrongylus tenuis]